MATKAAPRIRGPVSKRELVLDLCRGKDVLDLGCVEHSWEMATANPNWLHARIREVARSCVGVDFLEHDVARLVERGYDVRVGNVLTDEPPGQFDVVVAGDLVEHVENPGVLFDYVASALRPGGVAVVTTPNAFYPAQLWTILGRGRPEISPEHVAMYDPFTFANLVERGPLRIREVFWLDLAWSAFSRARNPVVRWGIWAPLHALTRALVRLRPYLASDFAVVLELREGGSFDPAESGRRVMQFLQS